MCTSARKALREDWRAGRTETADGPGPRAVAELRRSEGERDRERDVRPDRPSPSQPASTEYAEIDECHSAHPAAKLSKRRWRTEQRSWRTEPQACLPATASSSPAPGKWSVSVWKRTAGCADEVQSQPRGAVGFAGRGLDKSTAGEIRETKLLRRHTCLVPPNHSIEINYTAKNKIIPPA